MLLLPLPTVFFFKSDGKAAVNFLSYPMEVILYSLFLLDILGAGVIRCSLLKSR